MKYKITDKCPLTVILQLVGDQTHDLSAYGSKEEAWDEQAWPFDWGYVTEIEGEK